MASRSNQALPIVVVKFLLALSIAGHNVSVMLALERAITASGSGGLVLGWAPTWHVLGMSHVRVELKLLIHP